MKLNIKHLLNIILLILLLVACEQNAPSETSTPPTATGPAGDLVSSPTQGATATLYIPVDETVDPTCNVLWSRLQIGDLAYLTYGDRPNRVRSEPAKAPGNVIAQIYTGTLVTVVDGPVCADGLVFWKIEHDSIPGGTGWTAEGNGAQKHWLNPHHCASGQTALYLNHYALVAQGVRGLRVYDQQGSGGSVITQISANEMLKLVDGPYCTGDSPDDLVYWKVESQAIPGGSGWVAEYGFEQELFVRYLDYYWQADPTAFPLPPTLASIAPKWQTPASLDLAALNTAGSIAYVQDDWAWVVDADGTDPFELRNPLGSFATPHFLSWSPDGDFVTMALDNKLFLLSVEEIDGDLQASELLQDPASYQDVVWSFDGKYIAFSTGTSIYAMKTDGSDLHEISVEHEYCYSPTWSPYGIWVAYICWEYGPSIYLSRVDKPGTGTFDAMGHIVAWSPDGVHLAYNDSEDGLSIVEAATGAHPQTLVPEGSDVFAWSPDGKSIAFLVQDQVFMVNIADKSTSNLTGHTVSTAYDMIDGTLSWSPDGRYLTFEFQTYSHETEYWKANPIYILDVATGARAELIDQGTLPAWSPVIKYPIVQLPDCTSGWSRLRAGEQARVTGAPTDPPNRVRAEGAKSAAQTGVLYPGTIVDVLEGPVCSDGLVYWKVTGLIYPAVLDSTVVPPDIGWTAEGDLLEYYLEPYTP